jgi:catechol 2,3-dioxygenase-like lactoylglutathione lyase family enzyme
MPARVIGVRHVKLWVRDLTRSRAWYERVFDLEQAWEFPDDDGRVLGVAYGVRGAGFEIALREDPDRAAALHDADPFALAVSRPDLDAWIEHLDALGISHSPIIRATRGYGLGFRDPDGIQIRLYADDDTSSTV